MNIGAPEIILIILAILLLFGYKKLPDASRSLGRSMRIFKGEMKGLKDDDVRTKAAAETVAVRGDVVDLTAGVDLPAQLTAASAEAAARAAEARAADLRA